MPDQEMLDIVDEDDRVLSSASRRKVLDEYQLHRAVVFFVFDREGIEGVTAGPASQSSPRAAAARAS